jgi:hypothetical protein
MRRREFVMVLALLAISLVSANANAPADFRGDSRDMPVPASKVDSNKDDQANPIEIPVEASPLISRDKTLGAAYLNTLSILSTTNGCSLFFGGPAASVEVFKQLVRKVRKDYFPTAIGIQMSGETVNISNVGSKTEYRLFDKVTINANGPFYQRQFSPSNIPLHSVGTFGPNTKEVRVLMLLHELGHVMKGKDGNWLLPDDGEDQSLSRLNSRKIEGACGEQIKALRRN